MSIFYTDEGYLDYSILFGLVLMSFFKFMGFVFVVITFKYAIAAGMNLGIVTVVFNFCCITDSVVFYFFFDEKLSKG